MAIWPLRKDEEEEGVVGSEKEKERRALHRSTPYVLTMAKEKKLRKGPRTNDSGTTHASVSDNTIDGNETDVSDVADAIIEVGSRRVVVVNSPSIVQSGDARRGRRAGALRVRSANVDDDGVVDDVVVDRIAGSTGEKHAQYGKARRSNVATARGAVIVLCLEVMLPRLLLNE
jgi:hypothetical protein